MSGKARKPSGTPTGGQFTARTHSEPEGDLSSVEVELDQAMRAGPSDLETFVRHPSRDVRCEAATNRFLTPAQIEELARDEDWLVRREVATLPYPHCADRLADDPEVTVRVAAFGNPYLSELNRRRLEGDEQVQRVMELISAE